MVAGEGRLVAGRYRLERRVGDGAMGVLWQATDLRLDRVVAVKQLRLAPGLTDEEARRARQRVFREARIAARLQHPHAVAVYDVVDDGMGGPLLVPASDVFSCSPLAPHCMRRWTAARRSATRVG